jgi:hypothetical protein
MKNSYKISLGNPEGRRSTGQPKHTWEDIKINLEEIVWQCTLDSNGS